DMDPVVRLHAAQAMWTIDRNSDEVVPVLVGLLEVTRPNVSIGAAYVLGRIGEDAAAALPSLHALLAARELLDRLVLAGTISRIDPLDLEPLVILIAGLRDDPEADVRYLSAVGLGSAPLKCHRRVEKELTSALGDRNLRVQAAAAGALESLRVRLAEMRGEQAASGAVRIDAPVDARVDAVAAAEGPLDLIIPVSAAAE